MGPTIKATVAMTITATKVRITVEVAEKITNQSINK